MFAANLGDFSHEKRDRECETVWVPNHLEPSVAAVAASAFLGGMRPTDRGRKFAICICRDLARQTRGSRIQSCLPAYKVLYPYTTRVENVDGPCLRKVWVSNVFKIGTSWLVQFGRSNGPVNYDCGQNMS